MQATRLPPASGLVASILVLAVLAVPYAVVEGQGTAGAYYAAGDVNALVLPLFAAVSTIVFAAGYRERSSPDVVAGATLVLGTFMVTIAAVWALTLPEGFVGQLTTETLLQYHRWALVVVTAVVPLSAAWYTRALGIV